MIMIYKIYIFNAMEVKYIYLIYIYLSLLYNSSILDIEHSLYYMATWFATNPQSDLEKK